MPSRRTTLPRLALLGALCGCTPSPSAPDPPRATVISPPARLPLPPDPGERQATIPAAPLLSRGRPVAGWSSVAFPGLRNIDDGDYSTFWGAGRPTPEKPAWVAIDVGRGPTRVLVNWTASGSYNYEETDYGSPGAYRLETSGDSTDGVDGTWRRAAEVLAVTTHGHAQSVDFGGQRWLKLLVTGTPAQSPNGVQVSELDVHDVSRGADDSWFFLGDSITALAFNRSPAHQPSFASWIHTRYPTHFPAMVDGGTGGDKSDEGAAHVDAWLARNPDMHFWGILYGTNDAAGNASDTARFRANMQRIVDHVREAGRVPVLASIPYASDGQHDHVPEFNRVLEEIRAARSLPPGPDFYRWFADHPEELRDGIHPDDRGVVSMNRLWGEAVARLYER